MEAPIASSMSASQAVRALVLGYPAQIARALPGATRAQAAVPLLVLAYWVAGLVVSLFSGIPPTSTITTYLNTFAILVPFMVLGLLIARSGAIMAVERPARPLSQLLWEIRTSLATPQRVAHAIPALLSMLVFGGTFTAMKASIPALMPFTWDPEFEAMDRWLHGGVAPWELLQPLLGSPVATYAVNWAYNFWFYCFGLIWVWQAFQWYDKKLRLQFFLSMVLGWALLGNLAATLLSSAGPCYFGRVTGLPDPFVPLMDYLRGVNESYSIWALGAQDMLWDNYLVRSVELGSGISAMPSMHVAVATLNAIVAWRTRRWFGIVMTVYALSIMIGSVHLAWHYAIDGYLGAAGMLVIWWATGRFVRSMNGDGPKLNLRVADGSPHA